MQAAQPKLGGHVLPEVDQAGNDPVIPRHTHFLPFTALLLGLFSRSAISSSSVDALYPTDRPLCIMDLMCARVEQ